MSRRRSARIPRPRVSRRALSVGAGGVLVGAMVLGAATSSAQGGSVAHGAQDQVSAVAADIVPGDPVSLLGFAPPPKKVDPTALPQFRLTGDLPSGPLGIPGVVLQAYKLAAGRVGAESPQCKLPWFLLAGIGRIESNHASNGSVDQYGNTINPILGPALDGTLPGNEVIKADGGGHARAMGPMQFIPSTWASWGSDANGDGKADPHNVFDSTYSAGRYLCAGITDIMTKRNEIAAVYRYNHSMDYVANVIAWAAAYATGVMPTNPIPEPKHEPAKPSKKAKKHPKPGQNLALPADPETGTTTTPPPPTCIGGLCLPPDLIPPQLLPPQQRKAPRPEQAPKTPKSPKSQKTPRADAAPGKDAPDTTRPAKPAPGKAGPDKPAPGKQSPKDLKKCKRLEKQPQFTLSPPDRQWFDKHCDAARQAPGGPLPGLLPLP